MVFPLMDKQLLKRSMEKIKFPYKIIRRPKDEVINGKISKDLTTLLKGLCCLLVGLHHFSRIMVEQRGSSNPIYILLASQGGNIGVGLFFFLSGYGLMESSKKKSLSLKEILKKRYWKLIWPILIINIVFLLLKKSSIFHTYELGKEKSNFFLELFNFEGVDAVLWFINVLFVCYAIFYISEACRPIKVRNLVCFGLGISYIFLLMIIKPELHWHYTNIPMFFLGVMYSQASKYLIENIKKKYFWFLLLFIASATMVGWFGYKLMWARFGVCLLILMLLLWFNLKYEIKIQGSTPLSNSSYEFYLVHNKILMLWGGVNLIPFVLVSVGISLVFNRLFTYISQGLRVKIKI